MKKTKWPGNWKVTCHVCGWQYPSGEIKKRWDGLLVCPTDFETRHPQTLIRIQGERHFPSFVSKDSDTFQGSCDIATMSAYVDLGTADCLQADNNTYSYTLLRELFTNGH